MPMSFDLQILMFIKEHMTNPVFDALMPFFSTIGEYGAIWLAFGIVLLFNKRSRPYGIMLFIAVALGFFTGEIVIKNLVGRIRPCNFYPDVSVIVKRPHTYSFPSGHTCSSFAAALTVFFFDKRFGIAAFILAAFIAFSRMYLFMHYPTDILAGLLLGIFSATVVHIVYKSCLKNNLITG